MLLHLFAVHDRQAETFNSILFLRAPGEAMRSFADEVNRSATDNPIYNHPDDFDLYSFGTFDTTSGAFNLLPRPERLALGKNLKLNGSGSAA